MTRQPRVKIFNMIWNDNNPLDLGYFWKASRKWIGFKIVQMVIKVSIKLTSTVCTLRCTFVSLKLTKNAYRTRAARVVPRPHTVHSASNAHLTNASSVLEVLLYSCSLRGRNFQMTLTGKLLRHTPLRYFNENAIYTRKHNVIGRSLLLQIIRSIKRYSSAF